MSAQMQEPQLNNPQGQSGKPKWFFQRNQLLAVIFIIGIISIIILMGKNWPTIQSIWDNTLWLRWIVFFGIMFLTGTSILLWVFKSTGGVRRFRAILVVLITIAFATIFWILSTAGIFSETVSNVVLAIFTASAVVFTFLQWIAPLTPTNTTSSDEESSLPQFSSPRQLSPHVPDSTVGRSSSPQLFLPAMNASQSVNSTQDNTHKDFFISYAASDLSYARWIEAQLRDANYSTFFPEYDIRPGSNIVQELNRATAVAKRTILLLSPDYPLGQHPEWTASFFQDMSGKERKLIPVYIRQCPKQLQGVLGPIVPIDLIGKSQAEARLLLLDGVDLTDPRQKQTPPDFPQEN